MSDGPLQLALEVVRQSPFYQQRLAGHDIRGWLDLPFTTKSDLIEDQRGHPPYGSCLTRNVGEYVRVHQTSGTTTGQPLRWPDTVESWQWLLSRWDLIYSAAGVGADDRLLFAFSFGPFLGFWTAFESAVRQGWAVFPAGGMTSAARLRHVVDLAATVVLCTPTYALHLAEVAEKERIDLPRSPVRLLIVAGEPGGLIPATRSRIESAWGARVIDHYGLTEVGPVAVERSDDPAALWIIDGYYPEVIDPTTTEPAADGQIGELVLTNLGRTACPLIRYRTGDLVRCDRSTELRRLAGGILGRADDMLHVRGNNLYPTAIENILRRFDAVREFRIILDETQPLAELIVEVEPNDATIGDALTRQIEQTMRDELLFRPTVVSVTPGSLPRHEMKARRLIRRR